MRFITNIISLFSFLFLTVRCLAQADPDCHVEVLSGSPAFFQFNTVEEMTTGKSLYYSSCIRVNYTREPDKWELKAWAETPFFEGNDNIDCKVIKVTIERVCVNSPSATALSGDPKYGLDNSYGKNFAITEGENTICNGWISHANPMNVFSFYIYLKISIIPGTSDNERLVDKKEGYYLNHLKFYVKSTYK